MILIRNLTAIAVLLSATCFLPMSEAGIFSARSSKKSELDPLTELNNFLVRKTQSDLFEDNVRILKEVFIDSPESAQSNDGIELDGTRQLARLVASLSPTDKAYSRGKANTLKAIVKIALECDEDAFKESRIKSRRLNKLILVCFEASLAGTETVWAEADMINQLHDRYRHYLRFIDSINDQVKAKKGNEGLIDFNRFDTALNRVRRVQTGELKYPFNHHELNQLFNTEKSFEITDKHKELNNGIIDDFVIQKFLNDYMLSPCKFLIDNEASRAALVPFIEYGSTIFETFNYPKSHKEHDLQFRWASRYLTCELLIEQKDELIEDIKKAYTDPK